MNKTEQQKLEKKWQEASESIKWNIYELWCCECKFLKESHS